MNPEVEKTMATQATAESVNVQNGNEVTQPVIKVIGEYPQFLGNINYTNKNPKDLGQQNVQAQSGKGFLWQPETTPEVK